MCRGRNFTMPDVINNCCTMKESKLGLRNGSDLLNRLRRKYARDEVQQSQCQHNKTFAEEQSLQPLQSIIRADTKQNVQQTGNSSQKNQLIGMSSIKETPKQQSFCELLIIKNLTDTLVLYQKDLSVLLQNRDCLQQSIELISQKICKLKEIENNNAILEKEEHKAKQYLDELIREYHQSMQLVFSSQIAQQEAFNFLRSKMRLVIKSTTQDQSYIGFVNAWNSHIQQCLHDRSQIDKYLRLNNKQDPQSKDQGQLSKPKIKVEDNQFSALDEPKSKKKLSESERASLLGDLKSFAKNFKFPNA